MSSATAGENPEIRASKVVTVLDVLALGISATVFALPVLLLGPLPGGHDTYQHLSYSRCFSEQFWRGDLYPRWLVGMNHGLGSPSFFVYPPFASFVYAWLAPLGRLLHFDAFRGDEFLALFGSGLAAYAWVRTLASRLVALGSAVLYMLMPYHLAIDFYRRTALPECWALVWMPLFFYFTSQAVKGRSPRRNWAASLGMAVAYALLIFSHPISAAMFSPVPVAFALFCSLPGERIWLTCRIGVAMILGAGLASIYVLPAVREARNFQVSRFLHPPFFVLADQLIGLGDVAFAASKTGFLHAVALGALSVVAWLMICVLVAALTRPEHKAEFIFWVAVSIPAFFLTSRLSLPIWRSSPTLLRGVQFPWRVNILLCLAALPLSTFFLTQLSRLPRFRRNLVVTAASLLVLLWISTYLRVWQAYMSGSPAPRTIGPVVSIGDGDGWFDAWSVPGLSPASAVESSRGPRVRFLGAQGALQVRSWKSRYIAFTADSATGGPVMLTSFTIQDGALVSTERGSSLGLGRRCLKA